MAKQSYFQKLEQEAFKSGISPRTTQSLNWFKKRLKTFNVSRKSLLKDKELLRVDKPLPGRMYMYFYDPKHKETLPYYDRFPLIILVDKVEGGFTGLNLHYLPPNLRAKFFDKLTEFTNNKKYNETTRFRLKYNFLKGASKLKEFQPCFKRYLTSKVQTKITQVPATEWEVALFMPTEQFVKKSKSSIWKESRKSI
jgi:hypothetical protein